MCANNVSLSEHLLARRCCCPRQSHYTASTKQTRRTRGLHVVVDGELIVDVVVVVVVVTIVDGVAVVVVVLK